MPHSIAVLIVHGMGSQTPGFSSKMRENLDENFSKALKHMEQGHRPGKNKALVYQEGFWADLTQKGEDLLKKRMFNDPDTDVDWIKVRRFFVDYFGDAIAYFKGSDDDPYSQYAKIHKRIHSAIQELCEKFNGTNNTGQKFYLTVVSHSLGTVVLSDYFYDRRETLEHEQGLIFSNFFTMGSPIALYANRFYDHRKKDTPFHKFQPQGVRDKRGVWVNMFDEDDIVGYPLRPINDHCKKVVTADLNVSVGSFLTGWNPASHTGYWEDETVGKIIAEKLAIDWLRVNGWDSPQQTRSRTKAYKKRYGMPYRIPL